MRNQIFVFGSNTEGRHSLGAALTARELHGAIYHHPEGLQGNSYAIITNELRSEYPKITLEDVLIGVNKFLTFARKNPEMEFNVTPIGCGQAGFTPSQIAPLFIQAPNNVKLPNEFNKVLGYRHTKDHVIGLLTNDWHLWPKPPIFRSAESNWLDTQAGYLKQLYDLQPDFPYQVPIVMAGDMFDKPDPPSSFISWCFDNIPECYVVAGQHDLPNHRLQDIEKSALGLMIKLGKCHLLQTNSPVEIPLRWGELTLHGFSWGQTVTPLKKEKDDYRIHLAVIHAYIWTKNTGYIGASEESRLRSWDPRLKGYSAAVFGDNHQSFYSTKGPCVILNNGTFMIRKSDEKNNKPSVGLLHKSGKITRHYLDTSQDKYLDVSGFETTIKNLYESPEDVKDLISELENFGDKGLDYVTAVNRMAEKRNLNDDIKKLLLEFLHQ